ncbi:hypothetical protein J5TS2_11630 [Brevibacillus halotolerans]|nr:hypothetical protein J5TS2_11630 [Brevibacillus halotolerans]
MQIVFSNIPTSPTPEVNSGYIKAITDKYVLYNIVFIRILIGFYSCIIEFV